VNFVVRCRAAKALGWIGPEAKAAVPALIDALDDTEGLVQFQAAVSLGLMGEAAGEAVPALTEALSNAPCPPADREFLWALRAISRAQWKAAQDVARIV
jgi:HEAT repeat protein